MIYRLFFKEKTTLQIQLKYIDNKVAVHYGYLVPEVQEASGCMALFSTLKCGYFQCFCWEVFLCVKEIPRDVIVKVYFKNLSRSL